MSRAGFALGTTATAPMALPATGIPVAGKLSVSGSHDNPSLVLFQTPRGVWKSTNGGLSWDPLTDNLPATGIPVAGNAIGAVAVVPNANPALDIVYVGTGEGN